MAFRDGAGESDGESAEAAFAAAVEPHLPVMVRWAARVAPGHAEDVAQEALIRAWQRWPTYDAARGEPLPWLLAIVADRARRQRRSLLRRPRPLADEGVAAVQPGTDLDLERAIGTLPPRQRQAVDLYYFLDLDIETAAKVMGCAPGTVRATLHQARAALRTRLEDDDD